MCLAIPGKIESISGEDPLERMGKIDFGGILKEACLAYVPEARSAITSSSMSGSR
jgi:hydrogenase expression/formation protein HypC